MTMETEALLNSIMASFDRIDYIKTEEIPEIDLYMDQVTTFIESRMKNMTRNPQEDKILTKTMINNYAKNHLLPPPVKKKYSREHMLVLIFIYYFKGIMSMGDIQEVLTPLTDRFFGKEGDFCLEDVYREVFRMEEEDMQKLKEDVTRCYQCAQQSFSEAPEDSRDFLQNFSFICLLSFDVYVKKLLIEKLIDGMVEKKDAAADVAGREKKQD